MTMLLFILSPLLISLTTPRFIEIILLALITLALIKSTTKNWFLKIDWYKSKLMILMICFVISGYISSISSLGYNENIYIGILHTSRAIVIIFLFLFFGDSITDSTVIKKSFSFLFLISLISVVMFSADIGRGYFFNYYGGIKRLEGLSDNPNYYSFYAGFILVFYFSILLSCHKFTWLHLTAGAVILLSILLSSSRGALFSLVGVLVIYWAYNFYFLVVKGRINKLFIIVMLVLTFSSFFATFLAIYFNFGIVNSGRIEDIINADGSGRVDRWVSIKNFMMQSDLFRQIIGYGPYSIYSLNILEPHNGYLLFMFERGLLGLFSFFLFFVTVAYRSLKTSRHLILPISYLLFSLLVNDFNVTASFYIALGLIVAYSVNYKG